MLEAQVLYLLSQLSLDAPGLLSKLLDHDNPYKPILPYLTQSSVPEDPIPLLASSVLTSFASHAQTLRPKLSPHSEDALRQLYKYQAGLVKAQDNGLKDIAVQQFSALLRTKKAREIFWNQKEANLNPLFDILREAVGAARDADSTLWSGATSIRSATDTTLGGGVGLQLLYHVLLVVWQVSFEGTLVAKGLERFVAWSDVLWPS